MARSDDARHNLDELGALLRTHRKQVGLSGVEAARRAGFTQSKLSKIENGVLLPGPDDVRRLTTALGMSSAATGEALELARLLEIDQSAPRIVLRRGSLTEHTTLLTRFGSTGSVVAADPAVVPDWLRTRDYLLAASGPLSARNEQAATSLLAKRQRLLATPGITFEFYVYESALRTRVGSSSVMAEQIDSIRKMPLQHPNVAVRVIDSHAEVAPPLPHGFELRDDRLVVMTTAPGTAVITAEDDIAPFRVLVDSLRERALSEHRSQSFLSRLATVYNLEERINFAC
ncbi:helix-turn-helix transcriptional regulator [Lentzea sp.]|uniref:helix-turn-helix domain-containing protein n=1 Tax=Lentzea sp. TaxID=56099 RepID=UPI002ED0AFDE